MAFWRHDYFRTRHYYPHGDIEPGEIIEAKKAPEPAFFTEVHPAAPVVEDDYVAPEDESFYEGEHDADASGDAEEGGDEEPASEDSGADPQDQGAEDDAAPGDAGEVSTAGTGEAADVSHKHPFDVTNSAQVEPQA